MLYFVQRIDAQIRWPGCLFFSEQHRSFGFGLDLESDRVTRRQLHPPPPLLPPPACKTITTTSRVVLGTWESVVVVVVAHQLRSPSPCYLRFQFISFSPSTCIHIIAVGWMDRSNLQRPHACFIACIYCMRALLTFFCSLLFLGWMDETKNNLDNK